MFLSVFTFADEGGAAPDFQLKVFGKDSSVSVSSLMNGKNIVILSFFDTNCEPCRHEIPELQRMFATINPNVKLFLVCLDEKPDTVLPQFVEKLGITIPILTDPLGYRAGENYGVIKFGAAQIPQVFVIGKDGTIKKHYTGLQENFESTLNNDINVCLAQTLPRPKDNTVSIIYSASSNGYLESCNCPQNPFGGIVRKITAIDRLQETHSHALTVDSGDYFPPRADKLLSQYTADMMALVNYDMIALGDQELLTGVDFLKVRSSSIPFSCSNLETCDDKMCSPFSVKPYIIKKMGGYNVACISVINPNIFFLFPKDKMKNIKVRDHIGYLKSIVPEIRKSADIVVLLSHCGDDEDMNIAKNVDGIDVIVGGHSQTLHERPVKVNDTLIVQSGPNGQRVGLLELKMSPDKRISSFSNSFTLLDKNIPDDEKGRELVEKYKSELKEKSKALVK
jgi:2',3'-cyclic-nucleotide 2'-phosphodiesterase (5'-nucleotidase family)